MIFKHELKSNLKMFLIWTLILGLFNIAMLLVYPSLQETMKDMASNFEKMGDFAVAFGMDKLNIAETIGYYGTYVGVMLSICGGLFAAMIGCGILAKEEGGHTVEYLFTLPYSRLQIVLQKIGAVVVLIIAFDVINFFLCQVGLLAIGADEVSFKSLVIYHIAQMLFHLEVAFIGVLISACTKKVNLGIGLGIALILYFMDMMSRIIDKIDFFKYITPYYYANAADVLVKNEIDPLLLTIGSIIGIGCLVGGSLVYIKRDLAA